MTTPDDLRFNSLETIVASVTGHDEWKDQFVTRYLDFAPILDFLSKNDARRGVGRTD